ncbi:hypothetical protein ACHQM5_000725 [Ranunculus cassubicifolius]
MAYPELIFSQMNQNFYMGTFLYNVMIRGYAYNGPYQKCMYMFDEMSQRGLRPNNFTYPYVLNVLGEIGGYKEGKSVHCQIVKLGFECVRSVLESVLSFYLRDFSDDVKGFRNEMLDDARKIFDCLGNRPVELWNRMIYEYGKIGAVGGAREMFDEMPQRDVVSWNSMISCYGRAGDLDTARWLFEKMPEKNVVSWTTMVGAYASTGDLDTARKLFDEMPEKNVVSWNSMISGYTRQGKFQEALDLFSCMHSEGVGYDGFTLASALTACAHQGALEFGKWIHFYLIKDWFELGVIVGTALIEMYAKCGDVDRALKVFIKLGQKDVFCWNVMIMSLASHGRVGDAVKSFYLMKKLGLRPNEYTFTSVLFACSHGGLIEEGRRIFYSMEKEYGINPTVKHYGCLIDLFGRNGQLEEAHLVLKEMPFEPDIAIWGALLGGCRAANDFKLAEMVIDKIVELKTNEPGVHVIVSNIYASIGQWPEAARARERMEENKMLKNAGCSSVVV